MAEDDENLHEKWMYDFAWKQLENAQLGNERLDNKAMNIINFSSLIIPIIAGVVFYAINESITTRLFYFLMFGSLFLLLISIVFAFMAIWLKDQGIICTKEQFNKARNDDIKKILGNTAEDIADWQKIVVKAGIDKGFKLWISSISFVLALILIFLGVGCILFFEYTNIVWDFLVEFYKIAIESQCYESNNADLPQLIEQVLFF